MSTFLAAIRSALTPRQASCRSCGEPLRVLEGDTCGRCTVAGLTADRLRGGCARACAIDCPCRVAPSRRLTNGLVHVFSTNQWALLEEVAPNVYQWRVA